MSFGAVAIEAQKDKMGYAMAKTLRIVSLHERYVGELFPFSKPDQIGSPLMPGAMENAGTEKYRDGIIFLDHNAMIGNKQVFGMIVRRELANKWFGGFISPA